MMPRSPRDRSLGAPRSRLSTWCAGTRVGTGRLRAGQGGITLIEVLVTVLLLAMVVGALLPLLTSGQQGSDYERRRMSMVRNGRVALDKLVREMRAAESFRTLAPGQISFTLLWGDGTGAEPTAQYLLDNVSHTLQYRWSADYDYRRQISVRAQTAVAAAWLVMLACSRSQETVLGLTYSSSV